jgi:recombinational DNA repair ATPase RecF
MSIITRLGISGYRSLRDVRLELGGFTVVTGANGSGKSSLYRALRLLADIAQGRRHSRGEAGSVIARRRGQAGCSDQGTWRDGAGRRRTAGLELALALAHRGRDRVMSGQLKNFCRILLRKNRTVVIYCRPARPTHTPGGVTIEKGEEG